MKKAHRNFQVKPLMGCMGFLGFLGFLPKHGCCFSKRMRKVFKKNEKSMLQFCNKNSKRKGRLQWVKKPL